MDFVWHSRPRLCWTEGREELTAVNLPPSREEHSRGRLCLKFSAFKD